MEPVQPHFAYFKRYFFERFGFKVAFNIFTAQRVSCSGQHDRIDNLVACKLRRHERPIFREFLGTGRFLVLTIPRISTAASNQSAPAQPLESFSFRHADSSTDSVTNTT